MATLKVLPMPEPGIRCPECRGRGITYISQGPWDPDVIPVTCDECGGRGFIPVPPDPEPPAARLAEAEPCCAACGASAEDSTFVSITSREPHGEQFTDEGYRCAGCGTITMAKADPAPTAAKNLISELMRSLVVARNLDPAFRAGLIMATPRKPVSQLDGIMPLEKGA